jgi:hypothetical protein
MTLRFDAQQSVYKRINKASKHRARDKHRQPAAYQKSLIKYYRQGATNIYIKFLITHCVRAKNTFFNFMIFWPKTTFLKKRDALVARLQPGFFFSVALFFLN